MPELQSQPHENRALEDAAGRPTFSNLIMRSALLAESSKEAAGPLPATGMAAADETQAGAAGDTVAEGLAESLIKLAPRLRPETRARLGRELEAAGYASGAGPHPTPELAATLGLKCVQPLEPLRLARLTAALSAWWIELDSLVMLTWQEAGGGAGGKRQERGRKEQVRAGLRRYLAGDPGAAFEEVNSLLTRTRQLTGCLLRAMGSASGKFAEHFADHFRPERIHAAAEEDCSIRNSFKDWRRNSRAWCKFEKVVEELEEKSIDMDFRKAYLQSVEELMLALHGKGARPEGEEPAESETVTGEA